MNATLSVCAIVLAAASTSGAVNVLVISSGDPGIDNGVIQALETRGHTVTLGPPYTEFDSDVDLAPYDTVYFQANINWNTGDMPPEGQESLYDFVDSGGGLVTGEWVLYKVWGQAHLAALKPAIPAVYKSFVGNLSDTFTQQAADPTLNAGLPEAFEFPLDSYSGTETVMVPRCGAPAPFYLSDNVEAGVIGWEYGAGRVLCFATTNGPTQLADPEFGKLFSNAMTWASLGGNGQYPGYTADCDDTGTLDLFDFLCFNNRFVGEVEYADCDGNGIFDLFDFLCFVNAFNAGC
jgi:hypothetical protein